MNSEAAFLSTCVATPDDATARLVFADWLDEQDDFRGEFVRLGVEFDRTPPYDVRRFELGVRLRELLESPAFKKWLPSHPALKWGHRRGFLRFMADAPTLRKEGVADVAEWLASPWIERAEFDGHTFGSHPEWECTFGLPHNSRDLLFAVDNYPSDVLTRLKNWPHLRSLNISYLQEPWPDLAALPHLRSLTLDNPDWTMMPELHEARLPNLESLSISKEWEGDLPHWGTCFPKLRSLVVEQYNAYPDEQCDRFAECSQLRQLALYQRYQPLKAAGLKILAKMKELRSLTIGPWPHGSLEVLSKLTKLEHLGGYGAGSSIRGLESLVNLRWLEVGVGKFRKKLAAQITTLPQLARLDVECDAIETDAITALVKASSLRVLTIRCRNKKAPLSEVSHLQGLGYLRLSVDVTPEQLTTLQTALPSCLIVNIYRDRDDEGYDWE